MTTKELAHQSTLSPAARDLLPAAGGARQYAQLLLENHLWMDCIALMSHAIRTREAIWWGWYCARKAAAAKNDPVEANALKQCEVWIAQPTEENRQVARSSAERLDGALPVQALLKGIGFSGDIVNESTGERIPSAPLLANRFVNASVLQSIYALNAQAPEVPAAEFLKQAFDVADRIQTWNQYSG